MQRAKIQEVLRTTIYTINICYQILGVSQVRGKEVTIKLWEVREKFVPQDW